MLALEIAATPDDWADTSADRTRVEEEAAPTEVIGVVDVGDVLCRAAIGALGSLAALAAGIGVHWSIT